MLSVTHKMLLSLIILLSVLSWAQVEALSLKVRNGEKNDDDAQLDKEFHQMIGIPHRSEQQDVLLANIEMSKLVGDGVVKQADVTASIDGQDDEEAALDAEFHKLIGFPHRSEEQDDVLADLEMKRLIDEGRIEQSDVDLIAAMDNLDNLMNTADHLSRKERSTRMNDEEILESIEEVVTTVGKASEKITRNKAFAGKLLERSMFRLQNIAKALEEEKVSNEIDEKLKKAMKNEKMMDKFIRNVEDESNGKRNKRSAAKLEPKISLNDMLKGYAKDKDVVKSSSDPLLREKRSTGSLNNMLKGYYLGNNVVKAPSAPLRETRSVEADEKLSSAIDAAAMLDEALAGLDEDSYDDDSASTSSSRKRRNSDGNTPEKKSTSSVHEKHNSHETPDREYSYFVTRGYSEEEYRWLREEFNLSREEVDSVKGLNEKQFSALRHSLKKTPTEPEKVYTTEDLVGVLKSARELVPTELEAAAHGALHMGYHLGGRAKVAADPVVRMMNTRVLPEAKKMLGNAIERIPEDVKEWAGDGRRIAAKRVQAVAEYAGPRLTRMGKSMAKLQEELSVSAEEKLRELVPKIVPALQMLVGELRDTIELAREVIPPVMQKVGDQAAPYYHEVKNTMSKHVVKPVYAYMTSDTISEPVGQAVDAVAPLGRAAYDNLAEGSRVVYDEVSPMLGGIAVSSGEVMREQVMPAMEELGENARHQAGRVGETVKTSVRDVLKSTLDTVFDGVPKILQQVSHEVHDAAKVFRGQYSSALGKMRSRHEHQEEQGGSAGGHEVTSVSPPVFRPSKAPKRTYVTSTEL